MLTAAEGIALRNSYQGMYSALSKAAYNPPELRRRCPYCHDFSRIAHFPVAAGGSACKSIP
jgi:hypothetical protein